MTSEWKPLPNCLHTALIRKSDSEWECGNCKALLSERPPRAPMPSAEQVSAIPERVWLYVNEDGISWTAEARRDSHFESIGSYVPESRAIDAEDRLVEVIARAREAEAARDEWFRRRNEDVTHANRGMDALQADNTQLRSDLAALVPFAKQGLDLAVNWYAPHLAARAVLDRIGKEK